MLKLCHAVETSWLNLRYDNLLTLNDGMVTKSLHKIKAEIEVFVNTKKGQTSDQLNYLGPIKYTIFLMNLHILKKYTKKTQFEQLI